MLKQGRQFGFVNDSEGKSRSTSRALHGQGTYDLADLVAGLKATTGLPYTWDRKTDYLIYGGRGTNCTSVPTVMCSDIDATRTHAESSALTWSTRLDYHAADHTLLYLQSRRGYRAGGINDPVAGVVAPKYAPEYVLDFELGVKSDWRVAERNIRTNADVFYQDYTDIQ